MGNAGILADQHGFDFVLQDGLHHARPAGDHAEAAVAPAGDAGVGFEAQDNAAAISAEIVDRVAVGLRGNAQQIGLEAR